MSADLQWLLLRKNNCFMVKRVPEGPVFSKEPGNLANLHSYKYSGLANEKAIHVENTRSGLRVTKRKKLVRVVTPIRHRSGTRRALGICARGSKGFRDDLRPTLLARVSALQRAQREPKALPPKKLRGRKARVAASKSSS